MKFPLIAQKKPSKIKLDAGIIYSWCTCGLSKAQPFCDNQHRQYPEATKSLKFKVEKAGDYFLCNCKHSENKPFCDGTHNKL
ncbi:MAG: CDGSH iron-sulfur domain-containing protein [Bacteroidales bacterium]|nr:CDGSH iron-sulfur domain-containing protein [Bacteroidales bacterium]MBN2820547.1 CDGSH iron-sulfur domain-containing protein [Bacteroidales bacterium]